MEHLKVKDLEKVQGWDSIVFSEAKETSEVKALAKVKIMEKVQVWVPVVFLEAKENLKVKDLEKAPSSEERVVEKEKEMKTFMETEGDQNPVSVQGMYDLSHLYFFHEAAIVV